MYLPAKIIAGLLMALLSTSPLRATVEGINVDADGNYVVSYWGEDEDGKQVWRTVKFVPANKIEPAVSSKFKLADTNTMEYRYGIRSEKNSQQPLVGLALSPVNIEVDLPQSLASKVGPNASGALSDEEHINLLTLLEDALATPKGWRGAAFINHGGTGLRVSWSYPRDSSIEGLHPGQAQNGFGFTSGELPGIGVMRLRGNKPAAQGFPDSGPGQQLYEEVEALLEPDSDHQSVGRIVAVPKIPVQEPFDAAQVLASLRTHLGVDVVGLNLIDPVLASELDRGLQVAIEAARRGNRIALRAQLKTLRQTLKRAHPELTENEDADEDWGEDDKRVKQPIAKLAAKVLDFDIKYVLKRVGEKD